MTVRHDATIRRIAFFVVAAVAAGGAAGFIGALGAAALVSARAAPLASEPHPALTSRAESLKQDIAQYHSRLDAHGREAVDPTWASAASASFRGDLSALAPPNGFVVDDVDCRTTTCVGRLTFANYSSAKQALRPIAFSPWKMNCVKLMQLEEEGDSSPYATTIVFDCAETRASGLPAR